jgi:phage terminase large subunit GpA-like protein
VVAVREPLAGSRRERTACESRRERTTGESRRERTTGESRHERTTTQRPREGRASDVPFPVDALQAGMDEAATGGHRGSRETVSD